MSAVLKQIEQSAPVNLIFNEFTPFTDALIPVEPLPFAALPDAMVDWVRDVSERIGCSPDYLATCVITALSSLLGRKALIQPKQLHNWKVTPNLWGAIIGRPSTKKSPAMNEALIPLYKLEIEARKDTEEALKRYQADVSLAKIEQVEAAKEAKKLLKTDRESALQKLQEVDPDNIDRPANKRFIIHDATVEKTAVILSDNENGILTIRDELSGWMINLESEERAVDRAFYLMAFNGNQSFSYDRITRESIFIHNCICSVLGGIQPSKIQPYLSSAKNGHNDDGMLQRFQLIVYPDPVIKVGVDRLPNLDAKASLESLFKFFNDLPETPEDEEPLLLKFDPQAQQIFNEWEMDNLEKCKAEKSPSVESHLSKYPAFVSSLALIIHLADTQQMTEIAATSIIKACALTEYFESHARRIYGMVDHPEYGAKSLAEKLRLLSNPFTASDFRNKNWSGLKTAEQRQEALTILVKRGYLAEHQSPIENNLKTKIWYYKSERLTNEYNF